MAPHKKKSAKDGLGDFDGDRKKDATDLASWIFEQFETHNSELTKWHRYYEEGEAYHRGAHYFTYDDSRAEFLPLSRKSYSGPRLVWNMIGSTNRTICGVISQKLPTLTFTAASCEGWQESSAGRAVTALYKRTANEMGWRTAFKQQDEGSVRLGSYALGLHWNMNAGPRVLDPETNEELPFGMMDLRPIYPGQIVLPPSYVSSQISKAPWAIIMHVMHVDQIEREFGVQFEAGDSDLTQGGSGQWRYNSMGSAYGEDQGPAKHKAKVVLEYWKAPDKKHPRGRWYICVKEKIIKKMPDGGLPYEWSIREGRLPFLWQNWFQQDRFLRGLAACDTLRELNFYLNILLSMSIVNSGRSQMPKLMLPKGHGIDPESIKNPRRAIEASATSAFLPQYLVSPYNATFLQEAIANVTKIVESVSGISEILTGQNPAGLRTVSHAAMLAEIADRFFDDFKERRRAMLLEFGQMFLWMMAEKLDEEVGAEYIGASASSGWRLFKQHFGNYDFGIEIGEDSAVFQLPLVRRQQILEEYQNGLRGDPNDPESLERVRDALGLSDPGELDREKDIHANRAEGENILIGLIVAGQADKEEYPSVSVADDHQLHVKKHIRRMLEIENAITTLRYKGTKKYMAEMELMGLYEHIQKHEETGNEQAQPLGPEEMAARGGGQLPVGMAGELQQQMAAGGMAPQEQQLPQEQIPGAELGPLEGEQLPPNEQEGIE